MNVSHKSWRFENDTEWDTALANACSFAKKKGPDNVINISQTANPITDQYNHYMSTSGWITVFYWE